jgi:hypothetical protein
MLHVEQGLERGDVKAQQVVTLEGGGGGGGQASAGQIVNVDVVTARHIQSHAGV